MRVSVFTHEQSISSPVILPGDEILILHPNKDMIVLGDHGIPLSKVIRAAGQIRKGVSVQDALSFLPPIVRSFVETGMFFVGTGIPPVD